VLLGGHVIVGDHANFGGGAVVRQFVRIGEGAMIAGVSGVRADIIPFALAQGPMANLVGLNVIGMRRRGIAKFDIHRYREVYQDLFFGDGEFRQRRKPYVERKAALPSAARSRHSARRTRRSPRRQIIRGRLQTRRGRCFKYRPRPTGTGGLSVVEIEAALSGT
jgi:acyl-[acyl carrier protein]--UDP-N-acetylglucosamine O-acyltransferase